MVDDDGVQGRGGAALACEGASPRAQRSGAGSWVRVPLRGQPGALLELYVFCLLVSYHR